MEGGAHQGGGYITANISFTFKRQGTRIELTNASVPLSISLLSSITIEEYPPALISSVSPLFHVTYILYNRSTILDTYFPVIPIFNFYFFTRFFFFSSIFRLFILFSDFPTIYVIFSWRYTQCQVLDTFLSFLLTNSIFFHFYFPPRSIYLFNECIQMISILSPYPYPPSIRRFTPILTFLLPSPYPLGRICYKHEFMVERVEHGVASTYG